MDLDSIEDVSGSEGAGMYVYVWIHVGVYMYEYMYVCICVCVHVYMCIHGDQGMPDDGSAGDVRDVDLDSIDDVSWSEDADMCVCVYIHVCVYMYVCMYTYVYVHTWESRDA